MIRRGIASIAFDWKNKTEDLDNLDNWKSFWEFEQMILMMVQVQSHYFTRLYKCDIPKGSVSTNWNCPWDAADPPWL